MAVLTFFIGSYSQMLTPEIIGMGKGIYTVQLDETTGELNILHAINVVNPSYLAISSDNKFLYCSTELDEKFDPKVQAYKINDDFSLSFVNEQPIPGGYPCHIEISDNNILVACYQTGNVIQYPVDQFGKLKKFTKNCQHSGTSINKERQEGPHAHQVVVHPGKKQIYVCDLGIDTIKAYHFKDLELMSDFTQDIIVTKGGGPRHMVFNKDRNLAYVLNELTGAVSILKDIGGKFQQTGTYSSLPVTYNGMPSSSAIRIHPNGMFLYAANRILNAIAIFEIKGEKLKVLEYQYTEGVELREFNITPIGKWLIACHQDSHDTIVYQIKKDGKLIKKYKTKKIKTPVCVAFLK
jgi:6-phosphogluconolactonase